MPDPLDNDALLLLYVGDELSPEQRAAVDQRLASEPELRDALRQIADAHAWSDAQLARADEIAPLNETLAAAVARRTGRALRQAQVDRLARRAATPQPARRGLPFGWRSYTGAAIAASLFVALLVWWGSQTNENTRVAIAEEWLTDNVTMDDDLAVADVPPDPEDERLAKTFGTALSIGPAEQEPGSLASVEQDLRDLSGVGRGGGLLPGI